MTSHFGDHDMFMESSVRHGLLVSVGLIKKDFANH